MPAGFWPGIATGAVILNNGRRAIRRAFNLHSPGNTMKLRTFSVLSGFPILALASTAFAQGDPEVVARIIENGKQNSQVWSHLEHISHEIGPRLTGSSNTQEANEWTAEKFREWGLTNVHLHEWGTIGVRFDRGPSTAKLIIPDPRNAEAPPEIRELEFTSPSWSPGTDGPVEGRIIKEPQTLEWLAAIEDQLEGAWVLSRPRERGRGRQGVTQPGAAPSVSDEILARMQAAGIAGRIVPTSNDLVITSSQGPWRDLTIETLPTDVRVTIKRSDYDAINSRLADGQEVRFEANLDHRFTAGPIPVYNTVAEIPGTEFPDEVVIVSAHLDSWDGPGSMGTQDNGTGSSVTLEAARLLMAAGAQPKRTIRFILWTGEEQGLLGSRGYVESLSEEERAKISACFVDDGGTNYEGGLVCIESMAEMLREATAAVSEAFPEMPVEIIVSERMPRGGGSDHASFNAVGIPGFFWDERGTGGREGKDYRFIHHTQHDTPRYAVPEYLVQSAVCSAVTAYNLACADTLLPRQPAEVDVAEAEDAAPAPAADPTWVAGEGGANGVWNARTIGDAEFQFTLTLEMAQDGRVRGKSSSDYGDRTVSSGSFNKETGELTCVAEGSTMGPITITATITDSTNMKGVMEVGGQMRLEFVATKATTTGE
jgi:hypothetical protein